MSSLDIDELKILSKAINDALLIPLEYDPKHQGHKAILRENGREAKLRRIEIPNVPKGSVLIKVDDVPNPEKHFFRGDAGIMRRCDYVLFTIIEGVRYKLFIEIKSKNYQHILTKFNASECLFGYCNQVIGTFFGEDDLLEKYQSRYVLFYLGQNRPKTNLREKQPLNDMPEKFKKHPFNLSQNENTRNIAQLRLLLGAN